MIRNLILLTLLLTINLSAQNKYDFEQFVNEGVDYFTAPAKWNTEDFLYLGAAAGLTIGAMQFDEDLKSYTQEIRSENPPIPILVGRYYGEPLTPMILGSFFVINGNTNGNRFHKRVGFEILQATFFAMATTQIIKALTGRERPFSTDDSRNFTGPTFINNDFLSFPSGHTTIAFVLSTVLSENSSTDFLKVVSYLPAFLTAYSRIYENRHWLSDVVLGGIIGFAAAKFFVNEHRAKQLESRTPTPLFNLTIPLN